MLTSIQLHNLRNIPFAELTPLTGVNLFWGVNGAGKTSILEALSILGTGRSFRTPKSSKVIREGQQDLTVFAKATIDGREVSIGVRKGKQTTEIKMDSRRLNSASELAHLLPMQVINAQTFQLLDGGPKERRKFMDWLVFHVEQEFFPAWTAYQKTLKQRNSMLRHGKIDPLELASWDKELFDFAKKVDICRSRSLEQHFESFDQLRQGIDSEFLQDVTIEYYCGWDKDKTLQQVLEADLQRDLQQGYTSHGPHRAEIRLKLGKKAAAERLSRGQQKLLISCLRIAQAQVYSSKTNKRVIFLIDDLPAELDLHNQRQLLVWLSELNAQVFITGIDSEQLTNLFGGSHEQQVFHVEQGQVTQDSVAAELIQPLE